MKADNSVCVLLSLLLFSSWLTPVHHSIFSLSYQLFSRSVLPQSVAWVWSSTFSFSLFRSHSISPNTVSFSFLMVLHYLSLTVSPCFSLSLSPTGSGNTVDISPTWLPDTASAPFQFHPSFLPFSLFPPPTLSSLAGVKEKQKISPRPCRGDWYQIALKMEMPIKLTALLQPSFLSPF